MDEILRELVRLGFSEKEAAVYVASLELGSATVQDISHASKVNRATTYVMIDALTRRGLMSTFVRGKKRYYAAETPERFASLLRLQRKEQDEQEAAFQNALPMLLALFHGKGERPQIRYLEGEGGLQTVREIFGNLEGEFVQIVPFDDVQARPELMRGQSEHIAHMVGSGTKCRALLVMREPDVAKIPFVPGGEVRVVPFDRFPIHAEITVRGSHTFFYSYATTILSVIVVSREIAASVRALFDLAWDGAEKYPNRKM